MMQFVPIPTDTKYINGMIRHWLPFLEHISSRSKEPVEALINMVARKEVQVGLAMDEKGISHALLGIRYIRGPEQELIGQLIWLTGRGMKTWVHLAPEVERYLKEHVGCQKVQTINRYGWIPLLKSRGFKHTHTLMEKIL
jgi:hypothetical protein